MRMTEIASRLLFATVLVAVPGCLGGSDAPGSDDGGDSGGADGGAGDPDDPDGAGVDGCDEDPPNFPGGDEQPGDDADNDCDGLVDEVVVCASGGDFTTLAEAIEAAPSGTGIEVCPGTYAERLTIETKAIHIRSQGDSSDTILDAGSSGTAVTVKGASTGIGVTLEGFTIQNGLSATRGGAVRCESSTFTAIDVVAKSNKASQGGGGLFATDCELVVSESRFELNKGGQQGGGVLVMNGSGTIDKTVFADNEAVRGGGMYLLEGAVEIIGSRFERNSAALQGGALFHKSDALVESTEFVDNTAGWTGGGVYVDQHQAVFRDVLVQGSVSENDGGGMYFHQGTGQLIDSRIIGNTSNDDGGGVRIFEAAMLVEGNLIEGNYSGDGGGGIRISHVASVFRDNIIRNNEAYGWGGGIDMDNDSSQVIGGVIEGNSAGRGGGIHGWLFPWFGGAIQNVRFVGNTAWRGGGLYLEHNFTPVELSGLTFENNTADHGAGLYLRTTDFTLTHSVFTGNVSGSTGGAMVIGGPGESYSKVQDYCPCPAVDATGAINFVVAYQNQASDGGSAVWIHSPNLTIENSILFQNDGTQAIVDLTEPPPQEPGQPGPNGEAPIPPPSSPTLPVWQYNATSPATFAGMADPTGTSGNISTNPQFTAPTSGDFHLSPGSACIDAGNPTMLDIDGSRADMGRYGGEDNL